MKFGAVYGAALGDEISIKSLETYMKGGIANLKCPSGGQYKLNKVGEHVTCSIHVDEKNKE